VELIAAWRCIVEWHCIVEWSCSLLGVVSAVLAFLLYVHLSGCILKKKKISQCVFSLGEKYICKRMHDVGFCCNFFSVLTDNFEHDVAKDSTVFFSKINIPHSTM
jgi:hypothetical protein